MPSLLNCFPVNSADLMPKVVAKWGFVDYDERGNLEQITNGSQAA